MTDAITEAEAVQNAAFTRLVGCRSLLAYWRNMSRTYEAKIAQGKARYAAAGSYALECISRLEYDLARAAENYVDACFRLNEAREDSRERQRIVAEGETVDKRSLH